MTEKADLKLSVRPIVDATINVGDQDDHSISALLHRIGRQRGSFRNFTEESLLAELADPDFGPANADLDTIMETEAATLVGTVKEEDEARDLAGQSGTRRLSLEEAAGKTLTASEIRESVLHLVSTALNESALALDLNSLLLSSTRQAAAQSMSPALKEAIPAGALSCARVRRTAASKETASAATLLGFKAQGLTNASRALTRASERAKREQETDVVFWDEVQQLITAGWTVFRPRAGMNGLAVRFGAAPRQWILLEKGHQGHIDTSKFDNKSVSLKLSLSRAGRVRAMRTEQTAPINLQEDGETLDIITHLQRAKRSLVTSNIFDDLVRDARDLANQGVSVVDRCITVPLAGRQEVRIELAESVHQSGPTVPPEDVDMTDDDDLDHDLPPAEDDEGGRPREDEDRHLLSTLATILYSRGSSHPRSHPLRSFMRGHRHGWLSSEIGGTITTLFAGLGRLSWSTSGPSRVRTTFEVDDPERAWEAPLLHSYDVSFLATELHVSVTTTLQGVTRYRSTARSTPVEGSPPLVRRQGTHDRARVSATVLFEVNEAVMAHLLRTLPSVIRASDDEVRTDHHGSVNLLITPEGQIKLRHNASGEWRVVESDLVDVLSKDQVVRI